MAVNKVVSLAELGSRNLAQFPEDERVTSGTEWKVPCPVTGGQHLSLDPETNRFNDFTGCNWNDVSRGLLRIGVLPNEYFVKYEYVDESGKKLFVHAKRRPKEQGRPSEWTHGFKYGTNGVPVELKGKGAMQGIRRVLFDLPKLRENTQPWMMAGEKDCELLRYRFDKNATTRPFGELHWDDGYVAQLDHATHLTIVIDNDDAGWRGGWTVYSKLMNTDIKLRVLRPHDSVKDVFDHVNYGFSLEDLQPVQLGELQRRGEKQKPKSTMTFLSEQASRKEIDVTDDALAIQNIAEAINEGTFPELHQHKTKLFRICGDPVLGPLTVEGCTAADLRALLSEHTFTYKFVSEKSGEAKQKPSLPGEALCRAVLHYGKWTVPELELNPQRYDIRVPEGTLSMLTGEIRDSSFSDMHTCQTKVHYRPDVGSECPQFLETLRSQFTSEEDVQCALDGLAYALTGDTSWQLFYWWQGVPGSGKSTIALTLCEMLGSYSAMADDELLFGVRDTHPANIIRLEGTRLVVQDEIPERSQLKVARLRKHTTQQTIPGRGMGENFRDINISWKLLFTSNPKARFNTQGKDGIWRRMVMLHCETAIPDAERKKFYHRVLFRDEGSQIFNLLLERLPRIRKDGPRISKNVRDEVDAYEEETDIVAQFMSLIERRKGSWLSNDDLQRACESFSAPDKAIMTPVQLGLAMREAKFAPSAMVKCRRVKADGVVVTPEKRRSVRGWIGATIPEGFVNFDARWVPMNPDVKPRLLDRSRSGYRFR
jgi:P4 family phage/plasmid primase-like protien